MASVLIVDDEKSIRGSLREFLLAEGYEVETAADAKEGLRLLGEHEFDVIVSDIVLPGINGIQLLEAIQGVALFAEVIMITGEPTVETAASALRAGAFDYLVKPVGKNAVLRSVGNAARVKGIDDERRRLEEENRRYQQELEKRVQERTRDLSTALADLRVAQESAIRQERLNAISQMASGIAHDFNNVLMPILGMSEMLATDPAVLKNARQTRKMAGTIWSAAKDAREIVKRLRLIYGPGESEHSAIDFRQILDGTVALTAPKWREEARAEGRAIEIITHCPDVPQVKGNASEIREALTNLIFNAVDAMPDGGTITIDVRMDGNGIVCLGVADTGMGMDADRLRRCTEPYYTSKGERGSGLGLPMVGSIMERHGGRMEIDSAPEIGTTVRLFFPVKPVARPKAAVPQGAPTALPPVRVLVVDDQARSRELVARLLKADGHSVASAKCLDDALKAFTRGDFHLVITDRAMPGGGGDRLSREIQGLHPGTPVIMLTGFGDVMKAEGEMPEGISRVMAKPITASELRLVMREVLHDGREGHLDDMKSRAMVQGPDIRKAATPPTGHARKGATE